MRGRSQPDRDEPRVRIAESRYRAAPVFLVPELFLAFPRDAFPIANEARAAGARDHFVPYPSQRIGHAVANGENIKRVRSISRAVRRCSRSVT